MGGTDSKASVQVCPDTKNPNQQTGTGTTTTTKPPNNTGGNNNQNNNNNEPKPKNPPPQPVAAKKRAVQNNKANSTDMAILELKLQREKLRKATDKYYNLTEKMKEAAKEAMLKDPEKNKANAIYLIKRSKQYEHQIETTANQLLNLETSLNAIEDGIIQVQIMQSLENGAKALDSINKQLSRAEEVMDNVREAVAAQREITEILGAPVDAAFAAEQDDDELEEELKKIMGVSKKENSKTAVVLDQVKVPTHSLPEVKVDQAQNGETSQQTEQEQEGEEGATRQQQRIAA